LKLEFLPSFLLLSPSQSFFSLEADFETNVMELEVENLVKGWAKNLIENLVGNWVEN